MSELHPARINRTARTKEPARTEPRRRKALLASLVLGTACAATVAAPAQAATGSPNLVVTGITWTTSAGSTTQTTPTTGTPVTFSATVKNTGTAGTPKNVVFGVQFRVDGKAVSWSASSKSSLAPGASRVLTVTNGPSGTPTWPATAGAHTVAAVVDDAQRITESREDDNVRETPMTVSAAAGTVGSSVVVRDGNLFVDSRIGPSTVETTVNSRVTGQLSGACFAADGSVISGTGKGFGTYRFGSPSVGPGSDPGEYPFVVTDPNPARTTVSAGVQMASVRRDVAAYLDQVPCPVNGTAGLYQFRATKVESGRWDLTGPSGRIASTSAASSTVYAFAPPTSPALSSTVTAGNGVFEVTSTFRAPTELSWMASSVAGTSTVACFANGAVVPGTVAAYSDYPLGSTDAGVGGKPDFYPWGFVEAGTTSRVGSVNFSLLVKNFSQQQAYSPMACPAGSVGGLHEFHATRLDTALHPWLDAKAVTVRFSAPVDVTYRFTGPTA